jgi:hypothetical protein
VNRVALFAAAGGLLILLAVAVALFQSRQKRLARLDVREVGTVSSSFSSATLDSPPAKQADTPVIAEKTAPAPDTSEPNPATVQEKQGTAQRAERSSPPVGQAKPAKVKPAETGPVLRVLIKRRVQRTEEDLLEQIKDVPVVALDRTAKRVESNTVIAEALKAHNAGGSSDATLTLVDHRVDLVGLPIRRGKACRLPHSAATHFDQYAKKLRGMVSDAIELRKTLAEDSKEDKWLKNETVPVLMQMLMAEASSVREILTEQLARIPGKSATAALAQLALFDLHPQVRARAIDALVYRPVNDYRQALLNGFEHPWSAIADHAAEAIVALKMKDEIHNLATLLDKPDPRAPYGKPISKQRFVKELVRVNHLANCLLCHAPSFRAGDKVRGLVPPANQPLSPAYYAPTKGIFVRADVTYLKQDFSRMQTVAKPGKWPAVQRFDFFVRERLATEPDQRESLARQKTGPHEHQRALLFALRELTGHDPGPAVADWKAFVFARLLGR